MMATTFWSVDGRPMSAVEFIARLFGDLPELFKDEDELRALWGQPDTLKALLESLPAPFAHAHALLQTLRTNLHDLATLKELQKLLLREVIRAEKKIRELKTELRTIKGTADSAAARRSSYLKNRIEGFGSAHISGAASEMQLPSSTWTNSR